MPFNFTTQTNKNYLQTINPNAPDAGAALKVLSLNLPNFVGGSPIAPDGLLRPGLTTNAQVGGTLSAQPPAAAPSAALAGLSAQLGAPDQGLPSGGPPLAGAPGLSSPTAQSPFKTSSAPIAGLASSILGSTPGPFQAAPPAPYIETGRPTGPGGDVYGGGPAPVASPPQGGNAPSDALAQLLATLFQPNGGNEPELQNAPPLI